MALQVCSAINKQPMSGAHPSRTIMTSQGQKALGEEVLSPVQGCT